VLAIALPAVPLRASDDLNFKDAYDRIAEGFPAAGYEDLEKLANDGDTRAQYRVGIARMVGRNLERDPVEGYTWLEIAARCGPVCTSGSVSRDYERPQPGVAENVFRRLCDE
jgi:hypothetical protein